MVATLRLAARNCGPSRRSTSSSATATCPTPKRRKRSWNTDETLLRIHILPALGRLTLDQISGEHIAGLINDMRAKGYAGGTTNHVLVLLRYVFNLARKWNVPGASVNPTAGLATAPEVHRQRFLIELDPIRGTKGR